MRTVLLHAAHETDSPSVPVASTHRLSQLPRNDVSEALSKTGYYWLGKLTCHCIDGVTVISGSVPSYYLKQVAQETAKRTPGVIQVVNCVEVRSDK